VAHDVTSPLLQSRWCCHWSLLRYSSVTWCS